MKVTSRDEKSFSKRAKVAAFAQTFLIRTQLYLLNRFAWT